MGWGINRARTEGIAASVISADGKDTFYRRCGYQIEVGNVREGDGNPLKDAPPGGHILFMEPGEQKTDADYL